MAARSIILLVTALLAVSVLSPAAAAAGRTEAEITTFIARALQREATDFIVGRPEGGTRPVIANGEAIAFLGSTWDIAHTAGYSGQPVDVLVLVDRDAVIRGTLLVAQQEPVLTIGISAAQIEAFIDGFAGYDLREPLQEPGTKRPGVPDAISGATISSAVIRSGIVRTARTIAQQKGLLGGGAGAAISMDAVQKSWAELVAMQAVRSRLVSIGEADKALGLDSGADPAKPFAEIFVSVVDPPAIGASLLGEGSYSALIAEMPHGSHALFVAANGLYSVKGTAWRRSGVFERLELKQGEHVIDLTREQHRLPAPLQATDAPALREVAIFVLPHDSDFDPASPFTLSLIANRDAPDGTQKSARFALDYALPTAFLANGTAAETVVEPPLWLTNLEQRKLSVATIIVMLLALYVILVFQRQIAERTRLYAAVRIGYLLATLIVIGGLMGAQLSVVHVLTFLQAVRSTFSWEQFLLDPVIFVIWGWVAVAMLFWGRVFCGWLCPFGALQELLNKLARLAGIRQIEIPFALHERLWPTKYILFIGLFAVSFSSMTLAFTGAEAEPFKTVITLHFMREWPFVAYALALLAAGLFIERFYCRYLCALGAALAIPARLRMFEWLKRRPQCGKECRICASRCPVQAIHPEGQINPNECIYCLTCQTLYFNKHVCPPLKARAARRAAAVQTAQKEPAA